MMEQIGRIVGESWHSYDVETDYETITIPKEVINGESGERILIVTKKTTDKIGHKGLEMTYWRIKE